MATSRTSNCTPPLENCWIIPYPGLFQGWAWQISNPWVGMDIISLNCITLGFAAGGYFYHLVNPVGIEYEISSEKKSLHIGRDFLRTREFRFFWKKNPCPLHDAWSAKDAIFKWPGEKQGSCLSRKLFCFETFSKDAPYSWAERKNPAERDFADFTLPSQSCGRE